MDENSNIVNDKRDARKPYKLYLHLQDWFYNECSGKSPEKKEEPSPAILGTGHHSSKFELKLSYMRLGLHNTLI